MIRRRLEGRPGSRLGLIRPHLAHLSWRLYTIIKRSFRIGIGNLVPSQGLDTVLFVLRVWCHHLVSRKLYVAALPDCPRSHPCWAQGHGLPENQRGTDRSRQFLIG